MVGVVGVHQVYILDPLCDVRGVEGGQGVDRPRGNYPSLLLFSSRLPLDASEWFRQTRWMVDSQQHDLVSTRTPNGTTTEKQSDQEHDTRIGTFELAAMLARASRQWPQWGVRGR